MPRLSSSSKKMVTVPSMELKGQQQSCRGIYLVWTGRLGCGQPKGFLISAAIYFTRFNLGKREEQKQKSHPPKNCEMPPNQIKPFAQCWLCLAAVMGKNVPHASTWFSPPFPSARPCSLPSGVCMSAIACLAGVPAAAGQGGLPKTPAQRRSSDRIPHLRPRLCLWPLLSSRVAVWGSFP